MPYIQSLVSAGAADNNNSNNSHFQVKVKGAQLHSRHHAYMGAAAAMRIYVCLATSHGSTRCIFENGLTARGCLEHEVLCAQG